MSLRLAICWALVAAFGPMLLGALLLRPEHALAAEPVPEPIKISILLVRELRKVAPPLSLLDVAPADDGVAGARLAIADNTTTGRFLGQEFALDIVQDGDAPTLIDKAVAKVEAGAAFIVADVSADGLIKLADRLKSKDAIILNAGAPDERLREGDCRANVFHTAPSRAMLADALAQYLIWKQWRRWVMIVGANAEDKLYADAIGRSARRFGAKVLEERLFSTESSGTRRSDGGYEQVQAQIPTFTQGLPSYDVMIVADETNQFGEYIPYRTWDAKPVAGTSGLVASSWHAALEFWGGTQFLNRFQKLSGRVMRNRDYDAWLAVRAIGEAASRKHSGAYKDILAHLKSPEFEIAGFKGQKLTFRPWNRQLREPLIVGTAKLPVSVSPQPGFLHQVSELDTLGIDQPESTCKQP